MRELTIMKTRSLSPWPTSETGLRILTLLLMSLTVLAQAAVAAAQRPATQSVVPRSATSDSTLWASGQFTSDGVGNITALGVPNVLPNSDGKVSTFIYDAASRLTTATIGRAAGDRVETYTYDGFGNLLSRQIASAALQFTFNPDPDPA